MISQHGQPSACFSRCLAYQKAEKQVQNEGVHHSGNWRHAKTPGTVGFMWPVGGFGSHQETVSGNPKAMSHKETFSGSRAPGHRDGASGSSLRRHLEAIGGSNGDGSRGYEPQHVRNNDYQSQGYELGHFGISSSGVVRLFSRGAEPQKELSSAFVADADMSYLASCALVASP